MSTATCCLQLLWVKYQSDYYSCFGNNIPIYFDNTSIIKLSKIPIQHSKAMLIEIKYHFICDYMAKGVFDIKFVDTDYQWIDIFTKPLLKIALSILGNIQIWLVNQINDVPSYISSLNNFD